MTRAQRLFTPFALVAGTALPFEQAYAQEPAPPPPPPSPPAEAAPAEPSFGPPPVPPPPPGPVPQPSPARGPRASVHFDASEPGLRVLAVEGAMPVERVVGSPYGWYVEQGIRPAYAPVCAAPCTARMIPGQYELAIAKGGRPAVGVPGVVPIGGPSTVYVEYVDHSGLRIAGWVIGTVGTIAGIVMIAASVRGNELECDDASDYCYRHTTFYGGWLAGGVVLVVGSLVTSSILTTRRDEARVTVEPLSAPGVGSRREAPVGSVRALDAPRGLALALHF